MQWNIKVTLTCYGDISYSNFNGIFIRPQHSPSVTRHAPDKTQMSTRALQMSLLLSTRVGLSDSGPTLYLVQGRANPVLHGPNSTEWLFHHGEITYRVG